MKKILILCCLSVLFCTFFSCGEKEPTRQALKDLIFDGENLGDFLFEYFDDHYTDTYAVSDGKVEIRVDYQFFSSWGCISYYIRIERSIRKTIEHLTVQEVIENSDLLALQTEYYFTSRYAVLRLKLKDFHFTSVTQVE